MTLPGEERRTAQRRIYTDDDLAEANDFRRWIGDRRQTKPEPSPSELAGYYRDAQLYKQLLIRLDDFRDIILNQRGALAENGMDGDQVNDVLREFDAAISAQGEKK